jgi:signal transduction histidine kinase
MSKPTTILIVEDELIAADSLKIDLQKLGYQVTGIANSHDKAIKKINEQLPDLILMDIKLKGKDNGILLAQEIRENHNIPVIYLTAYADTNTLQQAKKTSPYGYLVKPYKLKDLSAVIEIALQKYEDEKKYHDLLKKAEELNEMKTHALAVASHDLRSPLTTILGFSELLKDYGDQFSEEKKKTYFDKIKDAVFNMNESLEELLLISRAEEGKLKVNREAVNIVYFFQDVIDGFSPCLEAHHQLKFIPQDQECLTEIDRNLMRTILNNLLSNAIKYSPDGGKIEVNLTWTKEQIKFTIEDQGIGIPPEYQERMFQLFQRADNVGTIKGNGLGLSIIKKAVELHNGEIEFQSKENQGTIFTVYLPK